MGKKEIIYYLLLNKSHIIADACDRDLVAKAHNNVCGREIFQVREEERVTVCS